MGMDPEKVPYLMEAGRFLGQARSELIAQRGEDPERLAQRVPARRRASRRLGGLTRSRRADGSVRSA